MSCDDMSAVAENGQTIRFKTDSTPVKSLEEANSKQMSASVNGTDTYSTALANVDVENLEEISVGQLNSVVVLDEDSALSGAFPAELHEEESDRLTLYVLDNRSLKLTDAAQLKDYYFNSRQLDEESIDVNNFSGGHLQKVAQMAMLPIEPSPEKRRKIEATHQDHRKENFLEASRLEPSTSTYSVPSKWSSRWSSPDRCSVSLGVGTQVEVRRNGKFQSAVIRYCKQGGCYKVQYADGSFEWVFEDELRMRDECECKKYCETVMVASGPQTGDTHATNSSRRSESKITQIPGITVMPTNSPFRMREPNFHCMVCNRNVYQKEPQCLVIRIPACDSCAEEKVILLDNEKKECGVQTDPPPSSQDLDCVEAPPVKDNAYDSRLWTNATM